MKRLGIFFFYEKNGDVDDFITYYLADLHKNLTELVLSLIHISEPTRRS